MIYFSNLDVLRTFLSLVVAIGHFFLWNGVFDVMPKSFFLCVDLFFVLSGFVLCQKTLNSKSVTYSNFIKNFTYKRILRLYPLYIFLFFITVTIQVFEFGKDIDSFKALLLSALLLQDIIIIHVNHLFSDTSIGIAWSISVELWVGLLFFGLVFILRKNTKTLFIGCIVLSLVATLMIILFSPNHMDAFLQKISFVNFGILRCLSGLALGTISFFIFNFLNKKNFQSAFFQLIEIAAISASISVFYFDLEYQFLAPYIFSVLIPVLAINKGFFSKLLSLEIFSVTRNLSYGIYLSHPLFVYFYRKFEIPFTIQSSLPYLILVATSAAILFKYIEKKGMNFKFTRFSKNKKSAKLTP